MLQHCLSKQTLYRRTLSECLANPATPVETALDHPENGFLIPCVFTAYYLHRTRRELIAERKLRWQLTDDGNVEITGRDLREREVRTQYRGPIGYRRAAS
jgi:hypothetical protein